MRGSGSWLVQLLGIPDNAVARVVRRVLFHALFVAAVTQIKSASNALYLSRRDPEGLAFLYVLLAVAVTLSSLLLSRALRRRRPLALLRALGWILSAGLLLLALAARQGYAPVYAALYVAGELYATLLSVLFWADVGERFDVREQKRVVGLLAAGGMLGAIVGGATVAPLADRLGVEALIALAAVVVALAIPLMGRDFRERRRQDRAQAVGRAPLKTLLTQAYPRKIAMLVGALAVLATLVDFHFRVAAAQALGEAELASLFGQLNAAVGLAGLGFQALVTSRLLATLGVFIYLASVPLMLGLLASAAIALPLFVLSIALKGVEMAGSYSLYQPGMQLLYGPIEPSARRALRPLIDGAAKKLGVAFAGLGLLLLSLGGGQRFVLPATLVTVLAVLLLLRALRTGYIRTLDSRLGGRRLGLRHAIDASDRVTREIMLSALRSWESREVLSALAILERWPGFDIAPHLGRLLVHPSETVRLAAIDRAGRQPDERVAQALREILARDRRRPRARAARALASVDPGGASETLRPLLYDRDPGVQVAAIAALMPLEGSEGPAHAQLGVLLSRQDHPTPVRRELAKLLGELQDAPFDDALHTLLDDEEPSVRNLACASAARLRRPSLASPLIQLLSDRHCRAAARRALAALGDIMVERLAELLDDRDSPLGPRLELPRVLRQIGSDKAAAALLFSNITDDATLRYRIALNLFELRREHPELRLDARRVDQAARRRLTAYRHYRPILRSLETAQDPAYAPLTRAVGDRLSQNLEMALRLVGLTRDPEMMQHVYRALDQRYPQLQAEAFELLDVALAGDPLRVELLGYLEEQTIPGRPPREELAELMRSRDRLLRGIACHVAETLGVEASADVTGEIIDMEGQKMDRTFIERLLVLEHVDLFEKLSMDDLAALAAITTERSAAGGETIYREGDIGDAMFIVVDGEVELLKGERMILKVHSGETIGQVSFMDGGPRPVTARVPERRARVGLLVIDRRAFMDLLSDRFELVTGLFTVLAQRLRLLLERTPAEDAADGR